MKYTEKFFEAVASMFKNKKTRTVIISVLAAVLLVALIILLTFIFAPKKTHIVGEFSNEEPLTGHISTYIFEEEKLTVKYFDGENTEYTEYSYYILMNDNGPDSLIRTNTETGKTETLGYTEVMSNGELIEIWIDSVSYKK